MRRAHARRGRRPRRAGAARHRGAARPGRLGESHRREERARARGLGGQPVPHADRRQPLRRTVEEGHGGGQPAGRAVAPGHGAHGGQGGGRLLGRAHRPAGHVLLHADPARRAHRHRAVPRHRRGAGAHHLARRGRRLRLQGHRAPRGTRGGLAGAQVPQGVPLDRGSPRAPDLGRQRAPAPLRHDRLCRRQGASLLALDAHHRHRRRRLFGLAVHRRPGAGTGHRQPAGTLRFPGLPLRDAVRGHQQARLHALPRRGAHRRVFRDGADDGRHRPRRGPRSVRGAHGQPGAPRADALRQRREQALRRRRLSGEPAPRARDDRRRQVDRAAAAGRTRRAA